MYNKHKKSIFVWACITRLIIVVVQFVANLLIPDHDAKVFLYPKSNITETTADKIVQILLGGFLRWDAQYFMHIAKYGYVYENTLAFFPLYPFLVKLFMWPFSLFVTILNEDSLLLLGFIIVNCGLFISTSIVLYELSLIVLNKELAYKSAILFCFNPASIFFMAPYTECLFAYLTFKSLFYIMLIYKSRGNLLKNTVYAILCITLSTSVRSNGILNIGFVAYFMIQYQMKRRVNYYNLCKCVLKLIFISFICLLPFLLIQVYDYVRFCTNFNEKFSDFLVSFAERNDFVMPGLVSKYNQSWCHKKAPFAYSYVQNHYWDVGFLRYFEVKQIPNFLLAFPIIFIILSNSFKFFKQHFEYCLNLGMFRFKFINYFGKQRSIFYKDMFVFIVHAIVLTLFCCFCIHVQVTTRMLCSASPVLYWFCSYYFDNFKNKILKVKSILFLFRNGTKYQKFILYYFVSYFFVGTIMFSNFLPWT